MSKFETQILKGVTILMMLFLHLFSGDENVALYDARLYICGMPFVEWLARAANPVSLFVILGGYGLYKVYQKGNDKKRYLRIWRLYSSYWVVLVPFVVLGSFMWPEKYPGDLLDIIKNITGYHTTYNRECWFLFPYTFVSLSASWLFRLTRRMKSGVVLFLFFCLVLCTSFLISRYANAYLYSFRALYQFVLYFHLLFAFMVGAMAAREGWMEKLRELNELKELRKLGNVK